MFYCNPFIALTTLAAFGINASSNTGAKGICVLGGVILSIGLSRFQKPFSATKAELSNGENLPRIPPARIGFGLHFESDYWHAELGATYNAKQDNIAEYETETAGYTLVNAAFNYYIDVSDNELVLFVRGNNLLDKEARVHASFIKDTAPLPGRSIVVGARMHF